MKAERWVVVGVREPRWLLVLEEEVRELEEEALEAEVLEEEEEVRGGGWDDAFEVNGEGELA